MMLDELIKDMKEKGITSVAPIRFIGKAKAVCAMLALMNYTEPMETCSDWWQLRLWLGRN